MLLEVYLEPCQTSLMKSICENTEIIVAVNYFGKKACYHIETSPLILYDNGLRHERVKKLACSPTGTKYVHSQSKNKI